MATDASVITAATLGGQAPGGMPTCQNCSTTMTPMWRRDDAGTILCNACGLFLKLHGRSRPVSLKSNIIKSRNRGNATTKQKRKTTDSNTETNTQARAKLQKQAKQATDETPQDQAMEEFTAQNNNIAPQHVFDSLIPLADFNTGSLLQHSPSATSLANTNGEPLTFEAVSAQNALLRTRVSELEVINDLFRGRVSELEQAEREARQAERSKAEEVVRLEAELAKALTKLDEFQK